MGILFSDIYPESSADSDMTAESDYEIMSNKKFSIKKLFAIKGTYLNQSKQKYVA